MQNITDVIIASYLPRDAAAIIALTSEILDTAGTKVRVLPTCLNACASVNRNRGLNLANAEVQIMIDDDMTGFPQGWVVKLVDLMERNPNCVMASPQLMNPNGSFGFMLGYPPRSTHGESVVSLRELPTACIAIRKSHLRFDESFVGSGWEDTDYCAQLRENFPEGTWMICHDVRAVHTHEMKNQREHFETNKAKYLAKWGELQGE